MKYAIASDIHGSATWCKRLLDDVESQGTDRLILLGDLMYHGPRNPLPEGYDPAKVADMLNRVALPITAVRGNCDSEVDQMLLAFPCMLDYALVEDGSARILCTHGHLDLSSIIGNLPNGGLPDDSILLTGHTHIKLDETEYLEDSGIEIHHLNPGSVTLPKDSSHSYLIYDDGKFEFRTL